MSERPEIRQPLAHQRLNERTHPLVEHIESELVRTAGLGPYVQAVHVAIAALHWCAANVDAPNAPPTIDRARLASTMRRVAARIQDRGGRL